MGKHEADVTVFIPTFNAEPYLEAILDAINSQKTDKSVEILVIDSGSTDSTIDILKRWLDKSGNLRLHQIPNSEFGHGKTRQLAAEMAKSEFIVYLSHDAIPAHDEWLHEILEPFELSDKVMAVTGKQIPRGNCPPLIKYDIQNTFAQLGSDIAVSLFYKDSFITNHAVFDAVRFYSDVNSATRRRLLLEEIPYRDVAYAEDQLFGEDVINAGYIKAYASRGSVIHSNDVTVGEYKKRIFDEVYGLKKNDVDVNSALRRNIVIVTKGVLTDSLRILHDRQYSVKRKIYWLAVNPLFHIQRWRGTRSAINASVGDMELINKHSLESSRKIKDKNGA